MASRVCSSSRPSPPAPYLAASGGARSPPNSATGRRSCRSRGPPPCGPPSPSRSEEEAGRWLNAASESEEIADAFVEAGIALLNRALFAQGAAVADPHFREMVAGEANAVRIGYGSGEEVAAGRYRRRATSTSGQPAPHAASQRTDDLRPQERVAAVLGGRERIDACEALLLRARADLDAGRSREAALQLRVGLEALIVELSAPLNDPGPRRGHGRP